MSKFICPLQVRRYRPSECLLLAHSGNYLRTWREVTAYPFRTFPRLHRYKLGTIVNAGAVPVLSLYLEKTGPDVSPKDTITCF